MQVLRISFSSFKLQSLHKRLDQLSGPTSGYRCSVAGVKPPECEGKTTRLNLAPSLGMSGAIPLLHVYAFMAWDLLEGGTLSVVSVTNILLNQTVILKMEAVCSSETSKKTNTRYKNLKLRLFLPYWAEKELLQATSCEWCLELLIYRVSHKSINL